jgi:hypothetical protein
MPVLEVCDKSILQGEKHVYTKVWLCLAPTLRRFLNASPQCIQLVKPYLQLFPNMLSSSCQGM